MTVRVHRIPFSTNVERVELAAAIKGVELEWVDHDPADRSALLDLSGQELVPVAEFGPDAVADSVAILERLEEEVPAPALYPQDPAERAGAALFVEWFNEVWKGPPNLLADDPGIDPGPLTARIDAWSDRFEALLSGSAHLLGSGLGIGDVCAWPFLRYAVDEPDPGDEEVFHRVLAETLDASRRPRLAEWVERVREPLAAARR